MEYMHSNQHRVILTLTGGGFLWEAKSLLKNLGNDYEYHFIIPSYSTWKVKVRDIPVEGRIHYVSAVTTVGDRDFWKKFKNVLLSLRDAYKIIRGVDPSAVICVGTSMAVPLCLWAKYFGKKAIFIESITRVTKPSLTGKILSTLRLSDRFYVQWPEAVRLYKGAVYRGTVL
jgi:UDP-N-acetylglucosamine:LPS N-acetylglucosamine transferase